MKIDWTKKIWPKIITSMILAKIQLDKKKMAYVFLDKVFLDEKFISPPQYPLIIKIYFCYITYRNEFLNLLKKLLKVQWLQFSTFRNNTFS